MPLYIRHKWGKKNQLVHYISPPPKIVAGYNLVG